MWGVACKDGAVHLSFIYIKGIDRVELTLFTHEDQPTEKL